MKEFIDISCEKNGQCLKKIIREGYGDEHPREGCLTNVNYSVKLWDNSVIYSTFDSKEPFKFLIERGVFIKGWEIGIPTMRRNEVAEFHMQSAYGYGGAPLDSNVFPEATMIFEIELLDWEGERIGPDIDRDGIVRYSINVGSESVNFEIDSIVKVKYVGKYNGNVFDKKILTFELGMGAKYNLPVAFEEALKKFLINEKSRIVFKPKYAFGETGCRKFRIPPDSTVEYIIEFVSFQKAKPLSLIPRRECFERASMYNIVANGFFKKMQFDFAFQFYKNSFKYLDCNEAPEDKDDNIYDKKIDDLFEIINSNLIECCLEMNKYYGVKKFVENCPQYVEHNGKVLFRQDKAAYQLRKFEKNKNSFSEVLEIEPNNATTSNQLQLCDKELKKSHQKKMSLFSIMFGKMSLSKEKGKKTKPNKENKSGFGHSDESDRDDPATSSFEQ